MNINCKGQSSFEIMFVLGAVILFSGIVLVAGNLNIYEISALSFAQNEVNLYKMENSSESVISSIVVDGYDMRIDLTGTIEDFDNQIVEEKIESNTKYDGINIIVE